MLVTRSKEERNAEGRGDSGDQEGLLASLFHLQLKCWRQIPTDH